MRRFRNNIISIALLTILLTSSSLFFNKQNSLAGDDLEKHLKTEKNRMVAPTGDQIERSISIEVMLNSGDREKAFNSERAASVEGYIFGIAQMTADEQKCNENKGNCDFVLYLAKNDKASENADCLLAGITSGTRALNPDISREYLKSMQGKRVIVTGWLFYDYPHIQSSYESHPNGFKLDRHTIWEIYPVTSIKADE